MHSIPEIWKSQARIALEPYINGSFSEAVKNPVLLLNFLYQHQIIPQPVYSIYPHPEKAFHFIALCIIGDIKIESEGSSKKNAKSNVAQRFLDYLVNFLGEAENASSDPILNNDFDLHGHVPNSGSDKVASYDDNSVRPVSLAEEKRVIPSELPGCKIMFADPQSDLARHETVSSKPMSTEQDLLYDFFDPFVKVKVPTPVPTAITNVTDVQTATVPTVEAKVAESSYIAPHFDPFARLSIPKLAPRVITSDTDVPMAEAPTTKSKIVESTDDASVSPNESPIQVLQKLAIRKYKLIPRFRIEDCESGYICRLVMDDQMSSGTGISKKDAKTKAAQDMLQKMAAKDRLKELGENVPRKMAEKRTSQEMEIC